MGILGGHELWFNSCSNWYCREYCHITEPSLNVWKVPLSLYLLSIRSFEFLLKKSEIVVSMMVMPVEQNCLLHLWDPSKSVSGGTYRLILTKGKVHREWVLAIPPFVFLRVCLLRSVETTLKKQFNVQSGRQWWGHWHYRGGSGSCWDLCCLLERGSWSGNQGEEVQVSAFTLVLSFSVTVAFSVLLSPFCLAFCLHFPTLFDFLVWEQSLAVCWVITIFLLVSF